MHILYSTRYVTESLKHVHIARDTPHRVFTLLESFVYRTEVGPLLDLEAFIPRLVNVDVAAMVVAVERFGIELFVTIARLR